MTEDNTGRAAIKAFAERIIRLTEEAEAIASDVKEIRDEARGLGYNVKALNAAIRIARMTAEKREEHEQFELELETYVDAVLGVE